jgi:hypothetical protein
MAKYPIKTLIAAEKLLADYQLNLNALNEPQKKAVLSYVHAKRYRLLVYILFVISLAVSLAGAFICYNGWHNLRPEVVSTFAASDSENLTPVTNAIFKAGFTFGMHLWTVFYMLSLLILLPVVLNGKYQIIKAFLPLTDSRPDAQTLPNQ